jgi:hypothetical protein
MFSAGAPPPEKNIGRISSQFDNKCDVSTLKWFPGVVRPVVERSCQAAACARPYNTATPKDREEAPAR